MKEFTSLEDGLLRLQKAAKHGPMSLEKILKNLSGRGRPIILIILSLPFCQPIQIPGLSMPFGVAIAFVGLGMAFWKNIWLPKKLLKKQISAQTLKKITSSALTITKKMKRWIHPRLLWLSQSRVMKIINGLTIVFLGLILALPLPIPMSNLVAAWSIFFLGVGILEDDGVFILAGYVVTLAAVAFLILVAIFLTYLLK